MGIIDPTVMPQGGNNSAEQYVLPYFRKAVDEGFKHYGSKLKRDIILSQGEEAVFALKDYLAGMLAYFVTPKKVSKNKGTRIRDEYIFELLQQAQESEHTSVRIFIYDHAGKLSLFTAAVIPNSLKRTLLTPNDYVKYANVAYYKVMAEQKRATGDTAPIYALLAERTDEIAKVLKETAEDDIRIEGKLLSRPFVTLEQILTNTEPYDVLEEVKEIAENH